jgi:thiamine biosynthesis lipoprotein
MGTFARLTAIATDEPSAAAAVEAGYARLEDVNRLMSDYRPDSEISRLNDLPADEGLHVSSETFYCLERAVEVSRASGGAFDVTCRPLVTLWKQAAKQNRLPSERIVAETLKVVGAEQIGLDVENRMVSRRLDGVQVDLGGVAKGYALDLATEAMRKAGASSVLVDVGGDVVAIGTNRRGQPWRIGIKHPFRQGLIAVLALSDRAVATSGVQQRFYQIDGQRYSHIIDPRTGWPAAQAPSVTVIAADGLTADAWATAFSVLGVAEGRELLEAGQTPELEVMWITGSADQPAIAKTEGFDRYVAK